MLTENRIVMPLTGNGMSFESSKALHDAFMMTLIDVYGGYTVSYGVGGWAGPKGVQVIEDVALYDVAFDDHIDNTQHFEYLALWLGGKLHQESVYFRLGYAVRYLTVMQARPGSNLAKVV